MHGLFSLEFSKTGPPLYRRTCNDLLVLFVICAMFSDCWFEQMDRGRKGQEKDGEESEMKGFDIFLSTCCDVLNVALL